MTHDQACAGHPAAITQSLQFFVKLQHTGVNELNTPVIPIGECIQDVGVEDKDAKHLIKAAQRVKQGRIVIPAEVTPQPD